MIGRTIRFAAQVFGAALMLSGGLWFFQGLGVIDWPEGSFMLRDNAWAIIGAFAFATGAALFWISGRFRQ